MKYCLIIVILLAAACSPAASTPIQPTISADHSVNDVTPVEPATPTPEIIEQAASERTALQMLPLTNARTGESFTLADFEGKTILVEPMATWCTNCRSQLKNVLAAHEQVDGDQYVFVALSVGENINDADLATYAEREGFTFVFAVATPDMLTQLVENFGRTAINPPSTPHFIIGPDGNVTELFTGSKSAADIISLMSAASEV